MCHNRKSTSTWWRTLTYPVGIEWQKKWCVNLVKEVTLCSVTLEEEGEKFLRLDGQFFSHWAVIGHFPFSVLFALQVKVSSGIPPWHRTVFLYFLPATHFRSVCPSSESLGFQRNIEAFFSSQTLLGGFVERLKNIWAPFYFIAKFICRSLQWHL